MAKRAKGRAKSRRAARPTLGEWKVRRSGETELTLTLPKGMVVTSSKVTIEDVLQAIATHNSIKRGRPVVKCCGGGTAIA
jgi:hypothetical protein